MTTTSPLSIPSTHSRRRTETALLNLPVFHAPPLRPPAFLDISKDLDAVRRRRALLSQRISAVWVRGHRRD